MSLKCLNDWRDEALKVAIAHGFTEASPGEDIALMHSELSEALEEIRMGRSLKYCYYEEKDNPNVPYDKFWDEGSSPRKPCGVPAEMADILIRVFHFCGKHNIDIEQAVTEKMIYNETRPYRHGNKTL